MLRIASTRPARVQREAGGGPVYGVGSSASSRIVSAATVASRSSAVGSGEMVIFNPGSSSTVLPRVRIHLMADG